MINFVRFHDYSYKTQIVTVCFIYNLQGSLPLLLRNPPEIAEKFLFLNAGDIICLHYLLLFLTLSAKIIISAPKSNRI